MNRKTKRRLPLVLTSAIGFSSILIPKPYSYIGIAFLLVGLIVLFVIGWKVSLRTLFEWGRNHRIAFNPELTETEKKVFLFVIALVASVFVAILIRSLYLYLI
jgi:hypothetical protein